MPVPGGPTLGDAEALLRDLASRRTIVGAGFSGLRADEANAEPVTELARALGL